VGGLELYSRSADEAGEALVMGGGICGVTNSVSYISKAVGSTCTRGNHSMTGILNLGAAAAMVGTWGAHPCRIWCAPQRHRRSTRDSVEMGPGTVEGSLTTGAKPRCWRGPRPCNNYPGLHRPTQDSAPSPISPLTWRACSSVESGFGHVVVGSEFGVVQRLAVFARGPLRPCVNYQHLKP
jgi:hypothetical protein